MLKYTKHFFIFKYIIQLFDLIIKNQDKLQSYSSNLIFVYKKILVLLFFVSLLNVNFFTKTIIMTPLFKKLQLPSSIDEILILNEPEGFCKELDCLKNVIIKESLIQVSEVDFALVFVTEKKQIENRIETIYPKLVGDAFLWFAYPKKSSKKYTSEITRDYGWGVLGDYNLEGVRQVAIDDDWSALRFRKVNFIKKMTRHKDLALSTAGREKITGV